MIIAMSIKGTLRSACAVWLSPLVGVTEFDPSQNVPPKLDVKFCASSRTRKLPGPTFANWN